LLRIGWQRKIDPGERGKTEGSREFP
jgi:hypothetical protein